MNEQSIDSLVSPEWLSSHLNDPDLRILDATVLLTPPDKAGGAWIVGDNRKAHDERHIPSSQYASLLTDFSAPAGRFPRPDVRLFKASLARLGIGRDERVVIYDRSSGVWAARLWWVMRSFGLDRAAVLDGGFKLWEELGFSTTSAPAEPTASAPFVPIDRPEFFVGKDEVRAFVAQGGACLVNALDASDFKAKETTGYARPGRIPGSLNIPASSLVSGKDGRFLPLPELRKRLAAVLEHPGRAILYCGGGVAACADALALTRLGRHDVAVYDASLEEWAADPSLPMEVEPS